MLRINAQKDRGQMKKHGDSMVGVIVTSNRCELEPLENLFSRGSLRLVGGRPRLLPVQLLPLP